MQTTNLIQSYISTHPATKQYQDNKAVKNFDVNKELANRTFIKPLKANGKLVRPTIFDIPSEIVKDIKYNKDAFVKAVNGKSNDHELGILNNLAMKIGGLAIASYLFIKKQTPMTKVFEFIGFASFFGAMDLWPKLFLQLPAKLIHGFNIREKYEDNQHRKKLVFSDNQFIPWDLYSDEEINKIGDKLKVPKDLPNRREFIQEKMRKIALQNNTMWMLTAGFAAPVMSALICNGLEKPVSAYLHQKKDKIAENLLTDFSAKIKKYKFKSEQRQLEKFLNKNIGETLTPQLLDKILEKVTKGIDPETVKSVKQDLEILFPVGKHFEVSSKTITSIIEMLEEQFGELNLKPADMEKLIPTKAELTKAFKDNSLFGSDIKQFNKHSLAIQRIILKKINAFNAQSNNPELASDLEYIFDKILSSPGVGKASPMEKALKSTPSKILTEQAAQTLKSAGKIFRELKAKAKVLDKYNYIKVAQAQETVLADIWNNSVESIAKALNFTSDDITLSKIDSEVAGQVLREKIETVVSDKKACAELVGKMEKILSNLHSKMSPLEKPDSLYTTLVDNSFNPAGEALNKLGFKNTKEALIGFDDSGRTSLKYVYLKFVSDRITGVKSSFYRLLQTIDRYYKIAHGEGLDQVLDNKVLREVKEEMVELMKTTLIEGHTADFSVKLFQKRNPKPNRNDYSQIEAVKGKVKNRYLGQTPNNELIEMPNDRIYFDKVMKLIFGQDTHPDIAERIQNSPFYDDFKFYLEDAMNKLGRERYFAFPNLLVDGKEYISNSNDRFNRLGCSLNEMFHKFANNKYNSKKWFSKFGKIGLVITGITVGSQFYFGKMKVPKYDKKEIK